MIYCPMCGNKFVPGALFCHQCGFKKQTTQDAASSHIESTKKITENNKSIPSAPLPAETVKKTTHEIPLTYPVYHVVAPTTRPSQPTAPTVTPDGKRVCPECNGRGVVWDYLTTECDYCTGSGKCHECEGTGTCEYCKTTPTCEVCGNTKVCYRCYGTGKCRDCNGSGKAKGREYKCGLCSGLGKI